MTVLQSLPVAAFCFVMVFVILAILYALILLFSLGINLVTSKQKKSIDVSLKTAPAEQKNAEFSTGEVVLINVDEPTAAMIMAIVSDDSEIPLSELCFKSIKAV